MRLLTILFFVFVSVHFAQAQSLEALKENKDIAWVAETDYVYYFELQNAFSYRVRGGGTIRSVKNDFRAACQNQGARMLTYTLLDAAEAGDLTATDKNGKAISAKELTLMIAEYDTVITRNPITGEEIKKVVKYQANPDKIVGLQVRQLWYFDEKTETLRTEVLDFAPAYYLRNEEGGVEGTDILFRVTNTDLPDLATTDFAWIKETVDFFDFSKAKVHKGRTEDALLYLTWFAPRDMGKTVFTDAFCGKVATDQDLVGVFTASTDTVVSYDPATSEETLYIVQNEGYQTEDIASWECIQYWYYDLKTHTLQARLRSIAPTIFLSNPENDDVRMRQLFYLNFED